MIELVCIDLDGTLVGSGGRVRDEVWTMAERARASGVRLAVCSGRPAFGLAREYAERLDARGWHVFQNGASVVQLASGESRSQVLPPDPVGRLIEQARATGRVLELYTDSEYAVESTTQRARDHAGLLGVPFRPRAFGSLRGEVVRAQWVVSIPETDAVLDEPAHGLVRMVSHSPVMPETAFVNFTPPGVDKASALRTVAEAYGVDLERVMMVGDSHNDLDALRVVGHPVAMGNAEPAVRDLARYQVGHVDDAGLADALLLAIGG